MPKLHGLYAIANAESIGTLNIVDSVEEVLDAGVKIIQYRDKINELAIRNSIAKKLRQLTTKNNCILIINDDVLLSRTVDADGVHIGKDDCSVNEARELLGPNKIIGVSAYNSIGHVEKSTLNRVDYIAFGSFFNSPTKPNALRASLDLLKEVKKELNIPICAIGGITLDNAAQLLKEGADMIAVASDIFSSDNPSMVVNQYLALWVP